MKQQKFKRRWLKATESPYYQAKHNFFGFSDYYLSTSHTRRLLNILKDYTRKKVQSRNMNNAV